MLPDDTRSKIKNITTGAIIKGSEDNCTAVRNLLCSSFSTSTTVKKDFESKAIIKEKQEAFLLQINWPLFRHQFTNLQLITVL
jgi:hypothetical protein